MAIRRPLAVVGLAVAAVGALAAVALMQRHRPTAESVTPEIRAMVELRQTHYREIGTAFKQINDELKHSEPYMAGLRRSAAQIRDLARDLPNWFPAGSGPDTGLEMEATSAVWERTDAFADAQALFEQRAEALVNAAAGTDLASIGSAVQDLGAACKNCHEQFRDEDQ